jgi:aldose 1-epimerase
VTESSSEPGAPGEPADLLVIEHGDVQVEVVPAIGGRLHRIRAHGHDVLRTPPTLDHHRREPFAWGGFPMVPWCNRIPHGRLVFGDRMVELPINTQDSGVPSAMHGLAYDRPWRVEGDAVAIQGDGELPWAWSASQRFTVDGDAVRLEMTVRNDSDEPMPAGVGIHPWFDASQPTGGMRLHVPADRIYPSAGNIPTGDPVPVGEGSDLRALVSPPWGLDAVFTGLTSHVADVEWPARGLRCHLTYSPAGDHFVVAAFENLGAVALEPQTHGTDGYRRLRDGEPGAISVLPPGGELVLEVGFEFSLTDR